MSKRLLLSILLVFMIGCASFSAPEEPAGQAPVAVEGDADAPEAGEAVTKEAEAPPEEPAEAEQAPGAEAEEERRPRDTRKRSWSALKAWVGYMQPDADDIKKAYYGIRGSHDRHVQIGVGFRKWKRDDLGVGVSVERFSAEYVDGLGYSLDGVIYDRRKTRYRLWPIKLTLTLEADLFEARAGKNWVPHLYLGGGLGMWFMEKKVTFYTDHGSFVDELYRRLVRPHAVLGLELPVSSGLGLFSEVQFNYVRQKFLGRRGKKYLGKGIYKFFGREHDDEFFGDKRNLAGWAAVVGVVYRF